MIDPKLSQAVETFHSVADAVAGVLDATTDWGASGVREGQYAVDLEADAVCLDALYGAGFRVLSEESGVSGPTGADSAPIVVVDPLDGSTNASRRVPWYGTALCMVDDDGPAAALVANLATGERFSAVRGGGGAVRDGSSISPSGQTELAAALVGVSGLPSHHYGWAQFRALGASAPDICAVACGATDAWCDMDDDGHGVWDYLASILILEEAGGVVSEVFGREICVLDHTARRSPVVAATSELLAQILDQRRRAT